MQNIMYLFLYFGQSLDLWKSRERRYVVFKRALKKKMRFTLK